jgi:uncharacterized iron-regulated membrane protein
MASSKTWIWIAVACAGALTFIAGVLAWWQDFLDETARIGKLKADCSQSYTPACDELEKRR